MLRLLPPRFRPVIWTLLSLSLLATLAPAASAQVIAVHFKDAKAAKKYKDHLSEYRGESVVIGEPRTGIVYKPESNSLNFIPNGSNQLFVVDPKHPEVFAYLTDANDERVPTSKKNLLTIQGHHIEKLSMLMRDQTLPGLTKEYNIREAQIEEFRAARAKHDPATREWQAAHVRLVTSMERLIGWLEATGFPGAIKGLRKALKKEEKQARGMALRARAEKAQESIRECDVPERLAELSQEISGGRDRFQGRESQHLRIYFTDLLTAEEVEAALALGETVIEGFRAEFVDPYLSESYPDHIPDRLFLELLFLPPDLESYERYTTGFYGISWRENRESRLASSGGRSVGGVPRPIFREYWKVEDTDLQGILCHSLGHALASLHYSGGLHLSQDWLSEATGYQVSFEYLGRNNVTCKGFHKEKTGYLKREKERKVEGEKTVALGRREVYNEVALAQGRAIDQIALKILFELEDADLAKSWSFYDYICRKEGQAGQEWLRAAGEHSKKRRDFIKNWREAAAEILGVPASEAFRSLEARWRAYAESEQSTE